MGDVVFGTGVFSEDDRRALALAACREKGCNCNPDIEFVRDPFSPEGMSIHAAQVAHDAWCELLK